MTPQRTKERVMIERIEIPQDSGYKGAGFKFKSSRTKWALSLDTYIPENSRTIGAGSIFSRVKDSSSTLAHVSLVAYRVEGTWWVYQNISATMRSGCKFEDSWKLLATVKYAENARKILNLFASSPWIDWGEYSPSSFRSSVEQQAVEEICKLDDAEYWRRRGIE